MSNPNATRARERYEAHRAAQAAEGRSLPSWEALTVGQQIENVRTVDIHELKVWPKYYGALLSGARQFEIRRNDRDFRVGDTLLLREWDPETGELTGEFLRRRVSYITGAEELGLLASGVVVMGLEVCEWRP